MKFALATTAAIFAAGSALAGGYTAPVVEPIPVVVEPSTPEHDWSGFYAGLQYGVGNAEASVNDRAYGDEDFDGFGLHGGYLHDSGKLVYGGELDYSRLKPDNSDFDLDLVRLRGRVGYDLGRFMPYITLGAANLSTEVFGVDISDTAFSYGIGADFAVTEKFTIGAEYTKQDFEDIEDSGADFDTDLIQIRGAYHF